MQFILRICYDFCCFRPLILIEFYRDPLQFYRITAKMNIFQTRCDICTQRLLASTSHNKAMSFFINKIGMFQSMVEKTISLKLILHQSVSVVDPVPCTSALVQLMA